MIHMCNFIVLMSSLLFYNVKNSTCQRFGVCVLPQLTIHTQNNIKTSTKDCDPQQRAVVGILHFCQQIRTLTHPTPSKRTPLPLSTLPHIDRSQIVVFDIGLAPFHDWKKYLDIFILSVYPTSAQN